MPLRNVFIKENVKALENFADISFQELTLFYLTAILAEGRKFLSLLSQMTYVPT